MADQGEIGHSAAAPFSQPITGTPDYPEGFWTYPCVLGDTRGQLYWMQGSNSLFRQATATQAMKGTSGWRWHNGGVLELKWGILAGARKLTATILLSSNAVPAPRVTILKNITGGFNQVSGTLTGGYPTAATLELSFTATANCVGRVLLQADPIGENQYIDWISLRLE